MSLNRYLKVQNRSNLEGDLKFEDKKKVTWGIISMFEYLKHSDTKLDTTLSLPYMLYMFKLETKIYNNCRFPHLDHSKKFGGFLVINVEIIHC